MKANDEAIPGHDMAYRGIDYRVSVAGMRRAWTIYPKNGPLAGAASGIETRGGNQGAFRLAVAAAEKAIDLWLDESRTEKFDKAFSPHG